MLPTISKKKIATTTGFTSNDKIVSTLYLQIVLEKDYKQILMFVFRNYLIYGTHLHGGRKRQTLEKARD